jgi:hypothetical protein
MTSLELDLQIDDLNDLKELMDEADRESWIAESSQWHERAELGIHPYLWELYEIPDTTVNFGSSPTKPRRANRAMIGLLRGVAICVTCSAFFALPAFISLRPVIGARVTPIA